MNHGTLTLADNRLILSGPVTITTVAPVLKQLDTLIAGVPATGLILDCEHMTPSDSAAIGLLLEMHRQAKLRGATLKIEGLTDQLVRLIHIYGVEWILGAA